MKESKLHYGWVVIFMGLLTTIAAHGFGRMSYTIILPAMKDGLSFNYTQLGLLGTGNFIGYLTMILRKNSAQSPSLKKSGLTTIRLCLSPSVQVVPCVMPKVFWSSSGLLRGIR